MSDNFTEPRPVDVTTQARRLLERAWPAPGDASWLVPLLAPLPPPEAAQGWSVAGEPSPIVVVRGLLQKLEGGASPSSALALFLASMLRERPEHSADLQLLAQQARDRGMAFEEAIHALGRDALERQTRPWHCLGVPEVARVLLELGALTPDACVDWGAWLARTDEDLLPRRWGTSDSELAEWSTQTPAFWLRVGVDIAINMVLGRLRATDEKAIRGDLVCRVVADLVGLQWSRGRHPSDFHDADLDLRKGAETVLRETVCLLVDPELRNRQDLVESLLWLWKVAYDGREAETPDCLRGPLTETSTRYLGYLRKRLAEEGAEGAAGILDGARHGVNAATHILMGIKDLWSGVKPLLLLLRHSPIALYQADLGWLHARDDDGRPPGAHSLAQMIMVRFQTMSRRKPSPEGAMADLRAALSLYCLEHLKSKMDSDGQLEEDAMWRLGYIHAAAELRVNPKGRGHRLLHHAREADPEPRVRAAAQDAYDRVRLAGPGRSPARARAEIVHALWWLRQAHMRALGAEVDAEGAQMLFEEELRYTTVVEQQ